MELKVKLDLTFILTWFIVYALIGWSLLKSGKSSGDIALCLSVLTPVVLGVYNVISSWIVGYPIIKPHFYVDMDTGDKCWLGFFNRGARAGVIQRVIFLIDGGIFGGPVLRKGKSEYVVQHHGYAGPWVQKDKGLLPYNLSSKEILIVVESLDAQDLKNKFCACRPYKNGKTEWIPDFNAEHNTGPYIRKFKRCKNCPIDKAETDIELKTVY